MSNPIKIKNAQHLKEIVGENPSLDVIKSIRRSIDPISFIPVVIFAVDGTEYIGEMSIIYDKQ